MFDLPDVAVIVDVAIVVVIVVVMDFGRALAGVREHCPLTSDISSRAISP